MFVILLSLLPAAPLPYHTPASDRYIESLVVGHWEIRWSGVRGWARFDPDGTWSCILGRHDDSVQWVGRWRVKDRRLLINEHISAQPPAEEVTLAGPPATDDDRDLQWSFRLLDSRRLFFDTDMGTSLELVRPVVPRRRPPGGG